MSESEMEDPNAGRVGEQHAAYRKGLVLGLTMAEVGILIIFVLLLLIGFEDLRHQRIARLFGGKVPIETRRLEQLTREEAVLKEASRAFGVDQEITPPDDFIKLVRTTVQALGPDGRAAIERLQAEIEDQRAARQALREALEGMKKSDASSIAEQIERQGHKLSNQEGQLARCEGRLQQLGQGKGERPCWVRPDGTIDYLFDVVLSTEGIRMREYSYPGREAERAKLPVPSVDPSRALSESEFLGQTEDLYQASLAENCRFFVVVYDRTAADQKILYKRLLRAVEGHFYKRLSDSPAPF